MRKHPVVKRISLLVPFYTTDPERQRVFNWLREYWRHELPHAEFIVGRDTKSIKSWCRRHPRPFSKTAAVNNAFKRSRGDIIVILDADAYMSGEVLTHCANRLRAARHAGVRLWFMPYRHLFRLTKAISDKITASCPDRPLRLPSPPPPEDVAGTDGSGQFGHLFGAMCQVMPREAFEHVGGMDERFRGWGGEDSSFMHQLDCLWAKHRNTPNDILHIWHPQIDGGHWVDPRGKKRPVRRWDGQDASWANDWLSKQYFASRFNKEAMWDVVAASVHRRLWKRTLFFVLQDLGLMAVTPTNAPVIPITAVAPESEQIAA